MGEGGSIVAVSSFPRYSQNFQFAFCIQVARNIMKSSSPFSFICSFFKFFSLLISIYNMPGDKQMIRSKVFPLDRQLSGLYHFSS